MENLFPVQIENIIGQHPDVHEVAVVAVPHVKYGECVGAWIRLRTAPDDEGLSPGQTARRTIREFVAKRMNSQVRTFRTVTSLLDRGKNAPAYVWFLEDDESLPKTASGKVQKNILRERSAVLAREGSGFVDGTARSFD